MVLLPGARLGVYEVTAQIGAGGMGQVFVATDTKLKRQVAIKILPPALAADDDRLARFQREAEVLASLNHPNIAGIYGIEGSAGAPALVMELVEGEDLSAIVARGPIPIAEALPLARQIADALEAAHEQGIIHRDLKPANIKVRGNGTVKVLDFGLAKALDPARGSGLETRGDLANSPTMTSPAPTAMGVILGTAAYMSPEQAKGRPADRTTDLWAFGCVLYEMLTGGAAFDGESVGEVLGSIFKTDPDWTRLPADTPASIRRLLRRCLQKDRALRLKDAGDARLEIVGPHEEAPPAAVGSSVNRRERVMWAAAVTALLVIAAVLGTTRFRTLPVPAELRLDIALPPTPGGSARFAVSPDGKRVVFAQGRQLWIRSFDSTSATPLDGTESAVRPFWSADQQSIGFFAEGKLRQIAAAGGQVRDLANAQLPRGGTWNRDNVVLFGPTTGSPIMKVSASGGEATPVTTLAPEHSGHYSPQFLPDGRHFIYYVIGSADTNGVYVGDLTSSETRQLLKTDSAAVYATSALLYLREGDLVAQPFDPGRLATTGGAVVMATGVAGTADNPAIAAADGGPVVFRVGRESGRGSTQFAWLDRLGQEITKVGEPTQGFIRGSTLSPDGRHVAYTRVLSAGEADIWLLETSRGVFSRFTFEKGDDVTPVWSPDGGRLVFGRRRQGAVVDLYTKRFVDAAGEAQLVLASDQGKQATDWSRDGKYLLYSSVDPKTNSDIWALRMDGDGSKPIPVVQTPFQDVGACFSPDGQWVAYSSNKSGRSEVYLHPFPGSGAEVPVSPTGGAAPRWRRDGKEIFYVAPDGRLMAVSIRPTPTGSALELDPPVPLFASNEDYMVAPDGQRFLLHVTSAPSLTSPLSVILNWKPSKSAP